MDSNLPKELQVKRNDKKNPNSEEFQIYTNERHSKRDSTKKKIRFKKGPMGEDHFPLNSTFQIPEKDKNKYLSPVLDEDLGKPTKYAGLQYFNPEKNQYPSNITNQSPTLCFDKDSNYLRNAPNNRDNKSLRNERFDNHRNNMVKQSFDREQGSTQVSYGVSTPYPTYQEKNREVESETLSRDINRNSSLICRAINYDGEPVTVNDQVIKDKLILSCQPRTYYGPGYPRRNKNFDSGNIPKYPFPPPQISVVDNINIHQTTGFDVHQYQQKRDGELDYTKKSSISRSNAYDLGSLGLGDRGAEKQTEKYEEQYRAIQCKRYLRTFKTFLWGLFIINLILLLTGIALLLATLVHVLSKPYINTVIGQIGFATWIWATMALSMLIILVAIYGIATSLTRASKMLFVYAILALILAIIILVFLIIFWIVHSGLQKSEEESMSNSFKVYRCYRWMHVAWDNLHEQFECCGINGRDDWKYIPPSCCYAETKYQKLRCIGHFISEEQAFKSGCRSKLEDYFTTMFLLISCLLVLAIILLLLGILAVLRLLKMYKIILLCRDMYMITP